MLDYHLPRYLPSADELPDSDETPVDKDWSWRCPPAKEVRNELQELIPALLKSILLMLWEQRQDWLFAIDMGIYSSPDLPPIVPDAFLSLGVDRCYDEELRPSYVLWDEEIVPIFVLEVVSPRYREEYTTKLKIYAQMGVLYYAIYSSKRKRKPRFEIYKLVDDVYRLMEKIPAWMPEIGLGIGYERGNYGGVTREWLYWYDEDGKRYLTPNERIEQEVNRSNKLAAKLRQLGIDPDE
jgi:Uma2 family endonuclease